MVERVECVEADILGRRRGDEYGLAEDRTREDQLAIEHDPIENWIARADQVPAALSAAIAAKIRKRYAAAASLLVYLNIGEFGIRQAEIEAAMAPAVVTALRYFLRGWDPLEGSTLWPLDRVGQAEVAAEFSIKSVIKSKLGETENGPGYL